ncbi:sporulation integral membrane protein YtvI [Lachnospiraceae bacterium MD335]|jgi:sporulation integral membrane protein YtvI|nr:sporulation integral membrane protein YtvI [Lachnospiraceae bacterium MD335]
MNQDMKSIVKALANLAFSLIVLLLCIFLVPRLIVLFMPLIIGWLISCIANPLVVFLESKIKIRRKAGTVVVIVVVIAVVSGIGYAACSVLFRQIHGFVKELPEMWNVLVQDLDSFVSVANQYLGGVAPNIAEFLGNLGTSIGEAITNLPSKLDLDTFGGMGSMVGSIANVAISVIMAMLSAYFFIADREWIYEALEKIVPKGIAQKYGVFYGSLRQAVGGYFKAQLRIEVWMYLLILLGLTLLKVRYALLIALLIAVIDILPFFGSGAVLVPWAIVTALGGDYARAIWFLVIWGVGQLFRQLIQPKIMGDSIGMEPIPTIILLFIGYKAAGVIGMLVAVPIGIIVVNMNEAGFFDTPKQSVRILVTKINNFRKLSDEDLKLLEEDDKE